MENFGKHTDRMVTPDSCKKGHGLGRSICRVCTLPSIQHRPITARHKADGPIMEGSPRKVHA